jgi:hypothetical protein
LKPNHLLHRYRRFRRHAYAKCEGRVSRTKGGSTVHYEFAIVGGGFAKGRTGPSHKPPPVGATVPVLYLPDNPRRNRMYPFSMVKLADY